MMSEISKRLSITAISVLIVISLMSSAVLAAPVTIKDVPEDHWAYEAVKLLVEKGYMGVYESGNFCGDDPVSRYLLAFVTAKLLRDVEAGRTTLSEDDMRVVRETATVLREQLAVVTARLDEVERIAAGAAGDAKIAQETSASVALNYSRLEQAMEEQRKQLLAEIGKTAGASDQKLTAVFGDLKKQSQEIETELGQEISELAARADSLEAFAHRSFASEAQSRADLEAKLTLSLNKISEDQRAYVAQMNELGARVNDVDGRLNALQSETGSRIATLSLRLDDTAKGLAANKAWMESALAALDNKVSQLSDALDAQRVDTELKLGSMQAYQNGQLSSAIEGERVAREKADTGLVQQIDALSLSLSNETQERKASDAEIAARQAELESTLNLKIDSAIQTERATRASELAELMARLESLTSSQDELEQTTALRLAAGIEREKADREKAQAGLAQQVSALSLSLDEESKAREALGLDMLARQAQLESALTRKIDSAIEGESADRKAAYAELSSKIDAFSLSLGKELETERAQREAADIAHQEEARRILDDIAAARRDITDIERKTAEADAAIIAALEIQESRVAELGAELARLAADVRTLQEYAAGIEAELLQMSEKTSEDYASQQAALAELAKALDQTSADLSAAIKANAAEDLKTNGRVLQNTMRIQDVARSLDATNERLGQTDVAVRQAEGSIEEITARLAEIDSHLASIDRLLAGSVDELAKKFSDDLVAERWEAEMREVKLQSMIEELEARVEKLEGEKAQADAKKPGSAGAIVAVLGVIAAVAAIAIGSGGK